MPNFRDVPARRHGSPPDDTPTPLRVATPAEQGYARIKAAIITLELRPGAEVAERDLARRLGMDEGPVREAIARLIGEGFMTVDADLGNRVAELSPTRIREFYRVRMMLEPASLHDVGPRLTGANFDELRRCIDDVATGMARRDRHRVVSSSHDFHLLLIRRAENAYLTGLMQHLLEQADRVRTAIYLTQLESDHFDVSTRGVDSHRAILAALMDRDISRAADLLRHDIAWFMDVATAPEMQVAFARLAMPEDAAT